MSDVPQNGNLHKAKCTSFVPDRVGTKLAASYPEDDESAGQRHICCNRTEYNHAATYTAVASLDGLDAVRGLIPSDVPFDICDNGAFRRLEIGFSLHTEHTASAACGGTSFGVALPE